MQDTLLAMRDAEADRAIAAAALKREAPLTELSGSISGTHLRVPTPGSSSSPRLVRPRPVVALPSGSPDGSAHGSELAQLTQLRAQVSGTAHFTALHRTTVHYSTPQWWNRARPYAPCAHTTHPARPSPALHKSAPFNPLAIPFASRSPPPSRLSPM